MVHRTISFALIVACLAAVANVECLVVRENSLKSPVDSNVPLPENISSRRSLLHHACRAAILGNFLVALPDRALAEDAATPTLQKPGGNSKPYAPVEALLPATRCKVWIDRGYGISSQLKPYVGSSESETKESAFQLLVELDKTLSARPELFTKRDRPLKRNALGAAAGQITASVSSANKSQYKENRGNLSIPNKMAAVFNQADVERQWGMLQYAESNREKDNPIRAALNYYTQQLVFNGDSYLLTASKEEKKQMIRSGQGLPTLTAVITSDLDLRDLYRNQLLTAIDDACAEVAFQVKQPLEAIDLADTVSLMNQAHVACDNWFALISEQDVREALSAISSEG